MSYHFETFTDVSIFAEEVLLAIIEIVLIIRLYRRIFGQPAIKPKKLYLQACIVMVVITILMRGVLSSIRPSSIPPVTVLTSLLFLSHYPSARKRKLLFFSILFVISWFYLEIADLILTPLEINNDWVILILAHLPFWILLELISKISKYEETDIPSTLWLLLMAITVSSAIVLFDIVYYIVNRNDPYLLTTEIPVMIVLLFINISLFIFFDKFTSLISQVKEKILLEQQLQMQNQHFKELEAAHNQIKTIQHDMKNTLRTASYLAAKQGQNTELIEFLNQTTGQITEIEQVVSTGNSYLDTIMNIKVQEMRREKIKVDIEIQVPSGLKLSFPQTVTIFGNLLDNAREACLCLPKKDRWIKIKIYYSDHTLFIRIENASSKVKTWRDGLPVTTKNNSVLHGLGLKNAKMVIDEIGTLTVEAFPDSFLVRAILYDL